MPPEYHIFFAVRPSVYETARAAADAAMGFPSGNAQTSIPALSDAPLRSVDGWALVALRKALVPANVEDAGDAEQLTKEQFLSALPSDESEA
jgi:hypothetical protein